MIPYSVRKNRESKQVNKLLIAQFSHFRIIYSVVYFIGLPKNIEKDEDDWSPYPSSFIPATPPAPKEQEKDNDKKPVSSAVGLFDDDMDNDDLFGSKIPTESSKSERKEPESPETAVKPEMTAVSSPEVQPKNTPTTTASAKVSLFGDDDDDDDLFGGPPPLPEPSRIPQKKPANKIFTDDSSDDDLFGSGVKSTKKMPSKSNVPSTSTAQKMTKDTKATDKLFSDSEDDDLFGTKSKPKGKNEYTYKHCIICVISLIR